MATLDHDACPLAYDVAGNGPPVLFIQGVGVHGRGWLPQVDALAGAHTCLTFDNRGVGRSRPSGPARLTLEQMAGDALALADAQGWSDFHAVGHSMGGHIALALALAATRRLRSLTLMCTSGRGRDIPPITPAFLWTSLRSRVGTRRARRRAFLEIVLPRAVRAEEDLDAWAQRLAPLFGHDLADTPPAVTKQIAAYRSFDATPRLVDLAHVPTLVLGATEDPISPPRVVRALAEGIPGARFFEVADAAHGVTITHAHEVNALLTEHLERADASSPW